MLIIHHRFTRLCHDPAELFQGRIISSWECPDRLGAIIIPLLNDGSHDLQSLEPSPIPPLEDPHEPPGVTNGMTNGIATRISRFITETHDAGYLKYLQDIHSQWVELGMIDEDGTVFPECYHLPLVLSAGTGPREREPKKPAARPGYYTFDTSSGITHDSWPAIVASAELAVEAVKKLFVRPGTPGILKPMGNILALCRPPGHHCTTKMVGGYCYLNNAVVAVQALRQFHRDYSNQEAPPKIAILDIDFHHGNGTQYSFYHDPSVMYVSIHGEDEFPYYTGHASERGAGDAEFTNLNLPLASGSSAEAYFEKLDQAMEFLEEVKPEYLLVSLGFDTYYQDPMGSFDIQTEDYVRIGARIRCQSSIQDVPAVLLLEGGYYTASLGANMLAFLEGWENRF